MLDFFLEKAFWELISLVAALLYFFGKHFISRIDKIANDVNLAGERIIKVEKDLTRSIHAIELSIEKLYGMMERKKNHETANSKHIISLLNHLDKS